MKKLSKIITLMIALIMSASTFSAVGCGKKVPDTDQTLQVYCYDAGYGTAWCTALLDLFKEQDWVKEKYPNLIIPTPTINDVTEFAESRLTAGKKGNTFDLMFAVNLDYNTGPDGDFLDLTEVVYNSTVPGESIKWKDKSFESYNESNTFIDPTDLTVKKQYLTSWAGGMNTILYNENYLMQFTDKVPNTTDELIAICAAVKAEATNTEVNGKYKGEYSFIQHAGGSYFNYFFPLWWAQYEGIANYKNFWNGLDSNAYSTEIFNQKGRLYSLEVMEELLDVNNKYITREVPNLEFIQAQTLFLQGNGLFHVNGDWFDNEMKIIREEIKAEKESQGKTIDTFKTMRMPIISKLGDKLGITDAELSALVDYVDGTITTQPSFTSTKGLTKTAVINAVREARTIVYSIGANHQSGIPHYANGKDVAVDFLLFMATDIAIEKYIEVTGGASLPFKYNLKEENIDLYNSLGTLQQTRHDYFGTDAYEVYTLPNSRAFPLYQYGGLRPFIRESYFSDFFAANKEWTAQDIFDDTKAKWTDVKWQKALSDSGLA